MPAWLLGSDTSARRRVRTGVALGITASLLTVAVTVALARSIATVFDSGSLPFGSIAVLLGLVLVRAVIAVIARPLLTSGASDLTTRLRRRVIDTAVLRRQRTEVAPLAGSGIDSLDDYLVDFMPVRYVAVVVPIVVLVVVAVIDPVTALILLFTGPMLIAMLALIGRRTRELSDRRLVELGWLRSSFLDLLRGLPTLQVHGRAEEMAEQVRESSERFGSTTLDVLRTAFQTSLVIEWAATAATALVAVQVAFRLAGSHMALPGALAALMLTPEFFLPWRDLASRYHVGQHGAAVLDELETSDLVGPVISVPTDSNTVSRERDRIAPARVEIHDVSFTHPRANAPAFREVSFTIEPGEVVAITGPSGSGKTTLAALVLGLLPPEHGTIAIDGLRRSAGAGDASAPPEWMDDVAWVPQHATCFAGTVRDNVRLGRPDATDDEIERALRRAGDVLSELDEGLDTWLDEGGTGVSAGQRQRIAIARAVVSERPVQILDEFTALLDDRSEEAVLDGVLGGPRSCSTLLIAHRPAPLERADRVFELRAGRLERLR